MWHVCAHDTQEHTGHAYTNIQTHIHLSSGTLKISRMCARGVLLCTHICTHIRTHKILVRFKRLTDSGLGSRYCVRVSVCVRACVRECVCACVRACVIRQVPLIVALTDVCSVDDVALKAQKAALQQVHPAARTSPCLSLSISNSISIVLTLFLSYDFLPFPHSLPVL